MSRAAAFITDCSRDRRCDETPASVAGLAYSVRSCGWVVMKFMEGVNHLTLEKRRKKKTNVF